MRFGYATPFTVPANTAQLCYPLIDVVKRAGYDFIEFPMLQIALLSEQQFDAMAGYLRDLELDSVCGCSMFPASVPLLGKQADDGQIAQYARLALSRMARLGVKTQVLGSPWARRLPEEMSHQAGLEELARVVRELICPLLEQYDITLALEPITRGEANFIHTLAEGEQLMELISHPAVGILADSMHMLNNGDTPQDFLRLAGAVRHVHVSERERGLPVTVYSPGLEGILHAVRASGYDGTVSFETSADEAFSCLAPALAGLKARLAD